MTEQVDKRVKDIRLWAGVCHFLPLVVVLGIPFANVLAPALVWFFKRDDDPFIIRHAKSSLNFQLTVTLSLALIFGLIYYPLKLEVIPQSYHYGILAALASLAITFFAMMVQAGMRAGQGEEHRYFISIPFFR
ncbi:MAG: DUF4870 domain-containing protein [Bacteroidetes bacterium]|nr:DUF4870 domain-containing protein [Bacteroidota bacterium]